MVVRYEENIAKAPSGRPIFIWTFMDYCTERMMVFMKPKG